MLMNDEKKSIWNKLKINKLEIDCYKINIENKRKWELKRKRISCIYFILFLL
jgi:hypothetical protein